MDFINKIQKNAPDQSMELYDHLEVVENILLELNLILSLTQTEKSELLEFTDRISDLREGLFINSYQASFIDEFLSFATDPKRPHSLNEDFTFARPIGYDIYRGKRIEVTTFKGLYISLCEYFLRKDTILFYGFCELSSMNGTKRNYFGRTPKGMIAPFALDRDLYIETAFSANRIRDLLRNILREYNIESSTVRLYFRKTGRRKRNYVL